MQQIVKVHPFQDLCSSTVSNTRLHLVYKILTLSEADAIDVVNRYASLLQGISDNVKRPFTMVESRIAGLKSFSWRRNIRVSNI